MNVKEFLLEFKEDIEIPKKDVNWDFEKYEKWHKEFIDKTIPLHKSVKASFFNLSNRLIEARNYHELNKLFEFVQLNLFSKNDELKLLQLVEKAVITLDENELDIKGNLIYLQNFLDHMYHEQLFESTHLKLKEVLTLSEEKIKSFNDTFIIENAELVLHWINVIKSQK